MKEKFRNTVWAWESVAGKARAHVELTFAVWVASRTGSVTTLVAKRWTTAIWACYCMGRVIQWRWTLPSNSGLEKVVQCGVIKSRDDKKWRRAVHMLENCATIQSTQARQRADRNLMKFSKDKCQVLHLVKRKASATAHSLGTDWLVSSSVERLVRFWWAASSMSQWCILSWKELRMDIGNFFLSLRGQPSSDTDWPEWLCRLYPWTFSSPIE